MFGMTLATVRRRLGPMFAGLGGLLALLLWLSPTEQTLGQTVKLVYLHGALVQTAILLFAVSLFANLVGFLTARARWLAWGKALTWSGVTIWLAHTGVSMAAENVYLPLILKNSDGSPPHRCPKPLAAS